MEKKSANKAGHDWPAREVAALRDRTTQRRERSRPLLGELALEAGLLLPDMLTKALERQKQWGGSLGRVLVSTGAMRDADIARLYGEQQGVPFIDLAAEPRDPELAKAEALDFYLRELCLPWRQQGGETVWVAADPDVAYAAIAEHEGRSQPVFIATQRDIRRALRDGFAEALTERSVFGLLRQMPESSAATRLSTPQIHWLTIGLLALFCIALANPSGLFKAANIAIGMVFLAVAALRYASIFVGLLAPSTKEERAFSNHGAPPDSELPVYTVMVPLFREARVLPFLADALQELDYPASRVEILLIFEEDDAETLAAAKALDLPDHFSFIIVPKSLPQTKPKACNFALPFARGEYLVIYDAEDLPEPQQLKKAVAAFAFGDERLACVQAQLNYYNWNENWLTRGLV